MPLLRVLHPPLLIPWSAIEKCELDKWFLVYWRARVYLNGRRYPLCFYGRAGQEMFRQWTRRADFGAADVNQ
jgi:hypothetical protein